MRALLIALAICASSTARADGLDALEREQQALYDRIAPSVVYIVAADGVGTGFVVGTDGLVLTNAHVVGKATSVEVVMFDGARRQGRVIERGADGIDLVLLDMGRHALPSLPLSEQPLRIGTWVASIGHGMGGTWTFTTGMVSNIYPSERGKDKPVFQTQIPLNPGNSGGPIVDRHGVVVGVVTAGIREAQSINFAIRSERALRSLPRLREACACLIILAPPGIDVFVDGAVAGKGPRVVAPIVPGSHDVLAIIDGVARTRRVVYPAQREVDLRAVK
jgi:serine protease Do